MAVRRGKGCIGCDGCRRPNCGSCINCVDMKHFGGKGKRKLRCIMRHCEKN
ncbi:JmjC domain-containing histone demethylation protein 1, partial [Geodia barretti]